MAFFKRERDDGAKERLTKVAPQIEQVRKRYASGKPRLLRKSDERQLRAEFTRVMGMKAAQNADWVVLWHEPVFRYVKDIEIRRTIGSTHEIRKGEVLYVIPDAGDNFDPFALVAVDAEGEEAGYLSMRDEEARKLVWESLLDGKTVVAMAKQNRKPYAALLVFAD